ncbi:MAG: hypothetical protein ACE5EN_01280 [Nitrospinota bacterium]
MLRGSWNQAILYDVDWLTKNIKSLVDVEGAASEVQIKPFRFRIQIGNVIIKPSSELLIIEPQTAAPGILDEVMSVAAEIWEKLPHTPITAIGHNYGFRLDEDDYYLSDDTRLDDLVKKQLPEQISSTLRQTTNYAYRNGLEFTDKEYILNIFYEHKRGNTRSLEFNFHYDVKNCEQEQINSIISSFSENYALAQDLADNMIKRRTND